MKKTIGAVLLIAAICGSKKIHGQMSLNAGLDYNLVMQTGIKTPSLNIGGTYGIADGRRAIIGNFKYFIPAKFDYTASGVAFSSLTDPQYIEVSVQDKVNFFSLSGGMRNYFKEGNVDDGGFFGIGSLGIVIVKESFTVGSYDPNLYDVGSFEPSSFIDFFGIFGIGYDLRLNDNMFVAAEIPISITMQGINSREGSSSPIPIIISPGVSFRYMFAN